MYQSKTSVADDLSDQDFTRVRLYSTKSFKSLGTLDYHREAAYAVAFAHSIYTSDEVPLDPVKPNKGNHKEDEEDEEGWSAEDSQKRARWLVSSGKEGRLAFWELGTFERP